MKSAIISLGLMVSLPSLAHQDGSHFDLESYAGDYIVEGTPGCGLSLEFSGDLLVLTSIFRCNDAGDVMLLNCDQGTGECHYLKNKFFKVILLQNGDFLLDRGPNFSDEPRERPQYEQFIKTTK